jgi:hypothetical protein
MADEARFKRMLAGLNVGLQIVNHINRIRAS